MKFYQKKSKGLENKKLNTNSELISRSKEKEFQDEETLSLQFIQKGEFERAEHIYKKLMSQNHINHIILNNLAAILGIKNKEDEMMNLLKKSINIHPNNPEAYNNIGTLYENKGNIKLAIISYKKAI